MIKIEDIVLDGKDTGGSDRKMPEMTEEEKNILQHHGVVGMRWGKGRKTKTPKQPVTTTKSKGVNEAAREKQFKSEYANRDKMSTRSLQNRVKRLQAEQQFRDLVNRPAAERAKAAEAIAEKKRKRNKMLLRTALGIYGNLPMESFGKKGKDLKDILGPSQGIAKAASSSDALKNSAIDENSSSILLHKGVKGMKWGLKGVTPEQHEAALDKGIGILQQQIAAEKDPNKKAQLQKSLVNYQNNQAETDKFVVARRTPEQTNAALQKGIGVIRASIKEAKDPKKKKQLQAQLKLYSDNLAASNKQLAAGKK